MELRIVGHDLPGLRCGGYVGVHVGIQLRREPAEWVPGDRVEARWTLSIEVSGSGPDRDFRGPAVQGRRGDRFVYLTWGEVIADEFGMFRRAKLMLNDIGDPTPDVVTASVHLTDAHGMPRCARLTTPAVQWS
ncbi:DUF5990 family protein [Skermania piniformis]|uniref:Monooxygenase n=1 Tax=Skermania pinensis TaxID=39122 RepID=A0ABX8S4U1_9ACTN|nr:DUF5990 family protein [Skermania piniformis]QXQ12863.1 monooxygenase [Skermania piniformis]